MTYKEALDVWSRRQFSWLPRSASIEGLIREGNGVAIWYTVDGYSESTPTIDPLLEINDIVREIVNTALGVIE